MTIQLGGLISTAEEIIHSLQYVNCIGFLCVCLSDVQDDSSSSHMTEWEKEREREEFAKAAHLFQPLSNMMASRFTRAKHDDDEQEVNLPAEVNKFHLLRFCFTDCKTLVLQRT